LETDAAQDEIKIKKAALANSKISCRICKGDHWTSKCPFKDSYKPLDVPPSESKEGKGTFFSLICLKFNPNFFLKKKIPHHHLLLLPQAENTLRPAYVAAQGREAKASP
jgi:hypothetical protein